ncbi:hypothetical protein [Brucella sp. IR073]|uniref:hypothetical protein n=1 Tax=unclassified Brucella TaxID=2632610 RepID=UPI003B983F3C
MSLIDETSLVRNERIKLLASNLDRLSTAFIAVGVLGNTFNFKPGTDMLVPALNVSAWIFPAIGLHLIASFVLGRLRNER